MFRNLFRNGMIGNKIKMIIFVKKKQCGSRSATTIASDNSPSTDRGLNSKSFLFVCTAGYRRDTSSVPGY